MGILLDGGFISPIDHRAFLDRLCAEAGIVLLQPLTDRFRILLQCLFDRTLRGESPTLEIFANQEFLQIDPEMVPNQRTNRRSDPEGKRHFQWMGMALDDLIPYPCLSRQGQSTASPDRTTTALLLQSTFTFFTGARQPAFDGRGMCPRTPWQAPLRAYQIACAGGLPSGGASAFLPSSNCVTSILSKYKLYHAMVGYLRAMLIPKFRD